jgi:hypothetical protein
MSGAGALIFGHGISKIFFHYSFIDKRSTQIRNLKGTNFG